MDLKVNLVIVAHPDDEILGFGGAGVVLVGRGETVQPVMLCGGVDTRACRPSDERLLSDLTQANRRVGFDTPILGDFPNIRMNVVEHRRIVQFIETQILAFQPHRIFTHHPSDLNDDHRQISNACMAAARLFQRRSGVRPLQSLHFMEIPSSTDWAFPTGAAPFTPNLYIEIGDALETKLDALGCYSGVMRPYPHPRSAEAIRGLAATRGAQGGGNYAEAFQTVFSTSLG